MATIKLPRLSDSWIKNPSYFTRAWDQTMTTIENSISSISAAQDTANTAHTAADTANTDAATAQATADTAIVNSAAAQTTADSKLDPAVAAATYAPITGAWATYTPTVGAMSGGIGSASASGRWLQIGKTVFVTIEVTIVANGTGAEAVTISLPAVSKNSDVLVGRETANTGNMLGVQLTASGATGSVLFYNNSYPGSNGAIFSITGTYETP